MTVAPLPLFRKSLIGALLICLYGLPLSAADDLGAAIVDSYIKDTLASAAQLDGDTLSAMDILKLRGQLLKGNGYWHKLRGQPAPAFSSFRFLDVRKPGGWRITNASQAGDVRTVKVDFAVAAYSPWLTEFELKEAGDEWKITAFKDITKRPIAPNSTANEVVAAYLTAAIATVNSLYETQANGKERADLTAKSGIGTFWVSSRKTIITARDGGAAFARLIALRPDRWTLGEFRQAGDFGEIKATLSRTRTFRTVQPITTTRTLVYELTRQDGEWFLTAFRKEDAEENKTAAVSDSVPAADTSDPGSLVRRQLNLLHGMTAADMRDAGKKSEGLWQNTRIAKRGLGRVIAMVMTMSQSMQGPITWQIDPPQGGGGEVTIKATIVSDKTLAFKAINFAVVEDNGGWLLSDAAMTR